MKIRILLVLSLGLPLTSCSVDPRWGPPRTGLLEPLKWQYEGMDPSSGQQSRSHPVALSDSRR
ncbi:MAG: hypothetical protein ACON5N_18175 [Akkermansiaceae bacterium]